MDQESENRLCSVGSSNIVAMSRLKLADRRALPRVRFPRISELGREPSGRRGVCISARHLSVSICHSSRTFPSFRLTTRATAMNFVDVQPKSFLDYAWTSPSAAAMPTTKPSKTSRKQNRCCDQCRKGKRACDAAILEDTLLETSKSGANPTVFHYSGEPPLSSG